MFFLWENARKKR